MNEPLYKTFLTAKLSPRSNSKIARQYFFYFSFCSIEKMKYVVVQKKNVIKNYMEFKDTRIWFKLRSLLWFKHDLPWTKMVFWEIWYRHFASKLFLSKLKKYFLDEKWDKMSKIDHLFKRYVGRIKFQNLWLFKKQ